MNIMMEEETQWSERWPNDMKGGMSNGEFVMSPAKNNFPVQQGQQVAQLLDFFATCSATWRIF